MDYKLLCTKCEQIALKCHSYVDKSILVEKSNSAWEEVKEKTVYPDPLIPHAGSSLTQKSAAGFIHAWGHSPGPGTLCCHLHGTEGTWTIRGSCASTPAQTTLSFFSLLHLSLNHTPCTRQDGSSLHTLKATSHSLTGSHRAPHVWNVSLA